MTRQLIAVLFGGISTEHEVSIITAIQVMQALKSADYSVIPVYITKESQWLLGNDELLDPKAFVHPKNLANRYKTCHLIPSSRPMLQTTNSFGLPKYLNFDVAFPVFHGKNGEDGTVQGLLQLYNIPYVGTRVIASSVGMDKHLAKRIAKSLDIHTTKDLVITRSDWPTNKRSILESAAKLSKNVFVKPVKMGSSIGITKAHNQKELINAIEVAFAYDTKVLIEESLEAISEINISIIGNDPYEVSATEKPAGSDEILSFQDKYLRGSKDKPRNLGMASLARVIPAPYSQKIISQVEKHAKDFFKAIEGRGLARVDFMITKQDKIYFNEINTIPGSLAFYLWEKSGLGFPQLVDKLVTLALEDHSNDQKMITTFQSNILSHYQANAAKGGKIS